MSASQLPLLQSALSYHFTDTTLLEQALTHRSCGSRNYERLEFLGDAILNFTITRSLYALKPDASEGDLSRIRSSLVNQDTLAAIARDIHLQPHIILGQGERASGGQCRASIQSDVIEAIFGAILLDSDVVTCQEVILELYKTYLHRLPDAATLKDPKTRLQEYLQGHSLPLPVYKVVKEQGKDHEKYFEVCCLASGFGEVAGSGSSRRKAEQQAASRVLDMIAVSGR